jgi:hypothetical protein
MILSFVFQHCTAKEILHSIPGFPMLETAAEACKFGSAISQTDSTTQ